MGAATSQRELIQFGTRSAVRGCDGVLLAVDGRICVWYHIVSHEIFYRPCKGGFFYLANGKTLFALAAAPHGLSPWKAHTTRPWPEPGWVGVHVHVYPAKMTPRRGCLAKRGQMIGSKITLVFSYQTAASVNSPLPLMVMGCPMRRARAPARPGGRRSLLRACRALRASAGLPRPPARRRA